LYIFLSLKSSLHNIHREKREVGGGFFEIFFHLLSSLHCIQKKEEWRRKVLGYLLQYLLFALEHRKTGRAGEEGFLGTFTRGKGVLDIFPTVSLH
jgi:hypothetical protein